MLDDGGAKIATDEAVGFVRIFVGWIWRKCVSYEKDLGASSWVDILGSAAIPWNDP